MTRLYQPAAQDAVLVAGAGAAFGLPAGAGVDLEGFVVRDGFFFSFRETSLNVLRARFAAFLALRNAFFASLSSIFAVRASRCVRSTSASAPEMLVTLLFFCTALVFGFFRIFIAEKSGTTSGMELSVG